MSKKPKPLDIKSRANIESAIAEAAATAGHASLAFVDAQQRARPYVEAAEAAGKAQFEALQRLANLQRAQSEQQEQPPSHA